MQAQPLNLSKAPQIDWLSAEWHTLRIASSNSWQLMSIDQRVPTGAIERTCLIRQELVSSH